MLRRRPEEPHVNHERWVISYADFITLLFAFFVVMYSVSSVNEGKYRVMSDSLTSAFELHSRQLDPVNMGEGHQSNDSSAQNLLQLPVPGDYPEQEDYRYTLEGLLDTDTTGGAAGTKGAGGVEDRWRKLSDSMANALGDLMTDGDARIIDKGEWLEVSIQSAVLFTSGSATLAEGARQKLPAVIKLLREQGREVQVEGHTDNVPIRNEMYPSNWELSAARAASVVRWFEHEGVKPSMLSAVGFADQHPVADNASEKGRMANRRIAIMVSRKESQASQASSAGNRQDARSEPLKDFRLTNADLAKPLPKGRNPVELIINRITLEQARQRWQIRPSGNRGTP